MAWHEKKKWENDNNITTVLQGDVYNSFHPACQHDGIVSSLWKECNANWRKSILRMGETIMRNLKKRGGGLKF